MRRINPWLMVALFFAGGCGGSWSLPGRSASEPVGPDTITAKEDQDKERGRRRRQEREDEGELDPSDIPARPETPHTEAYHQRVRENMQPINVCFGRALVRTPGLSGSIDIEFVVAPSGRVSGIRVVRSTFRDTEVGACITQAIREMSFPPPAGGQEVTVTHTFRYASNPSSRRPRPATPPDAGPSPADAGPPPPPSPLPPTKVGTSPAPRPESQHVEEYRQHLIRHTGGIRRCYSEALARNPNLSGQLEVRFAVSPDGTVPVVEVTRSTLGDPAAERCVSSAIRELRFPRRTDSTVIVTHSFAFSR